MVRLLLLTRHSVTRHHIYGVSSNDKNHKEAAMKITKRQLRRMIAEAMPHGGVPDVVGAATGVPGGDIQNLVDEYKEWAVEYMGTPSGANSSSVLATFLVDRGLDKDKDVVGDMSDQMGFDPVDLNRELTRQQRERTV